ncbi:MAG: hypothetical protein D6820_17400 [Lentisphaerae bacterium]|nr:MAG: hypothetical protein D6820_17400 [Lentisphaerota bacterium]
MSCTINIAKVRTTGGLKVLYNADHFQQDHLLELLGEDPLQLFSDAELICETGNARSYRLPLDDHHVFAKIYKPRKWHRNMINRIDPACFAAFKAGIRLYCADTPTPLPLFAVAGHTPSSQGFCQILCTQFCNNTQTLDQAIREAKPALRNIIFSELAYLLAEFHGKGFYSNHLRSANILVREKKDGSRAYWFIDLDRMKYVFGFNSHVFIRTVSRALFEFFDELPADQQQYLLQQCFNAGLKQNIFKRPSDIDGFLKRVQAQIRARR